MGDGSFCKSRTKALPTRRRVGSASVVLLFNRLEKGICLACVAPKRFLYVSSVLSLLYALSTAVEALFAFLPSLQWAAKSMK